MSRLFISYSRHDEALARQLATDLSTLGAQVWIDVDSIPPGMNWSRAIQQGLDACEVMLLIVSPESMSSRNVEDEWNYFHTRRKPILPLLCRDATIPYQLDRVQRIDFREPKPGYGAGYRKLIAALAPYGVVATPPKPAPAPPIPTQAQPIQRSTPDGRLNFIGIILAAIITVVGGYLFNQAANPPAKSPEAPTATLATILNTPSSATSTDTLTPAPPPTTPPSTPTPVPVTATTSAPAETTVPTATTPPVATSAAASSASASGPSLERGIDLIAVCSPGVTAQVQIGTNELHTLVQSFTAQVLARPGACVCLQRTANPAQPVPSSCNAGNTVTVPGGDWRNNDMVILVDAMPVLTCTKQPSQRLYRCP